MNYDDARTLKYWLGQDAIRREMGYHAETSLIVTEGLKDAIDDGVPGLLYLFADPEYKNHVVLAYGYKDVRPAEGGEWLNYF